MPTLVHCTNVFNPLSADKHCPHGNMIIPGEVSLAFYYAGRDFNILKSRYQCEMCAVDSSKYIFSLCSEKGIFRPNRSINWTCIRRFRRKKKTPLASGIPQANDLYRAFQVLHDLGILTMNHADGWEIRDLSGATDDYGLCPSYYKVQKLYFVDMKDAIRYCKSCLSPKWGFFKFEVRKGDQVFSQNLVLSVNLKKKEVLK